MLDSDVAMLYERETKVINQTRKRNSKRFPDEDFCFQLTEEEYKSLRSQIVTLKINDEESAKNLKSQFVTSSLTDNMHGGKRKLPYVYTEQGISMLSPLLNSEIAIQVSINIMRAFVEMRRIFIANSSILERLTTVEYKLLEHDKSFNKLFNALQTKENFKQKVFFEGQIYDAYSLIIDIIKEKHNKIIDGSIIDKITAHCT